MLASKICFVVAPLGLEGSEVRTKHCRLMQSLIHPAMNDLGFVARSALNAFRSGQLQNAVIEDVVKSELVVADLAGSNANVLYELGIRHMSGKPCVLLADDLERIPIDVRNYSTIRYDLGDGAVMADAHVRLVAVAREALSRGPQVPYPLRPEDIIDLTGATVLVERREGHRDHYFMARHIAEISARRIALIQRSSTLVLGPERGWDGEHVFYDMLLHQVDRGTPLMHIVSVEGIAAHVRRVQSEFPYIKGALRRLSEENGVVGIRGKGHNFRFKRTPDERVHHDLKQDRQARTLVIEPTNGHAECVVVTDIGGAQSSFHLRGPKVREFMDQCQRFYDQCEPLTWKELRKALGRYRDSDSEDALPCGVAGD